MQTGTLETQKLKQGARSHCHNHRMWSLMVERHLFDTHLYKIPQDTLMPEDFKCLFLILAPCRTCKCK